MSKKNKNVLSQSADALNRIADNLEELNTILYTIGAELITGKDELIKLAEQLKARLDKPLQVTVDFESFTKAVEKQTKPAEAKEMFKVSFGKTVEGE
jgi:prefoldin subunit 5